MAGLLNGELPVGNHNHPETNKPCCYRAPSMTPWLLLMLSAARRQQQHAIAAAAATAVLQAAAAPKPRQASAAARQQEQAKCSRRSTTAEQGHSSSKGAKDMYSKTSTPACCNRTDCTVHPAVGTLGNIIYKELTDAGDT
jgi:hypothetical protein